MRRWLKVLLLGGCVIFAAFLLLAGTAAFHVVRHLDMHTATQADADKDFDAIRSARVMRPPLIEINPQTGDVRVNRTVRPDGRPISTLHILSWTAEGNEVFRTQAPIWLLRFSALNVLSKLGIAPSQYRLTVEDIERYGPGIILDHTQPGRKRVLLWVE